MNGLGFKKVKTPSKDLNHKKKDRPISKCTQTHDDLGTNGETIVFCRYDLQLESLMIINTYLQIKGYTSKYRVCMKSLIQEYTMMKNINYNDQSKCFENITKFMILDDQLSVHVFNGLIHHFFFYKLSHPNMQEKDTP